MSWSIESGYDHKCHSCGCTWYESDGGCDCEPAEEEETEETEEEK